MIGNIIFVAIICFILPIIFILDSLSEGDYFCYLEERYQEEDYQQEDKK